MNNNQYGQAAVEFAVSVSALIAMLLAIPIIGKIGNANIMSIRALDYAAWRVREGNTNPDSLSREVSDRYFGETALKVDDEKINDSGARLGRGKDNRQIYQNDSVTIDYVPNDTEMDGLVGGRIWNEFDRRYNLDLYKKKGTVSINLPLENLSVIPEIADSLVIRQSVFIDNQTLAARDSAQINTNIEKFDDVILPYNSRAQKTVLNDPSNLIISAMGTLNINVLDNYEIEDVEIDNNAVPADRLVEFTP